MNGRCTHLIPALALAASLLLGWAAPVAAQQAAAEQVEVRVLPRSEVTGAQYTLGEVAELDGFDLAQVRRLAAVSLGRAPLPGRSLRLSAAFLRSRLERALPAVRTSLVVPPGAVVVRAAQVIPGAQIAQRVLAAAAEAAAAGTQELEQTVATPVRDAVLPVGEVTWQIRPVGRRVTAGGALAFRVVARVAGRDAWQGLVRVNQEVYQDVVVARRRIRRDQVIAADDIAVERKAVTGRKDAIYLTRAADAVGAHAKRPIAQGEWLHKRLVVAGADIAEGGRVTLVYRTRLVHFSTPGVALVGGKIGDFIPVRNLQSGRIVHGIVQPAERVRVN